MADGIGDILKGVRSYWGTGLSVGDSQVKMGYRDDRVAGGAAPAFPLVTLHLYDIAFDNDRRVGKPIYPRPIQGDTTAIEEVGMPIPVNLFFQLDTFCTTPESDWTVSAEVMAHLGRIHPQITLTSGTTLPMVKESVSTFAPDDEDRMWRRVFRFYVPAYFDSPNDVQTVKLILTRHLDMQKKLIEYVSEI